MSNDIRVVLLVENNPDDEALTMRAFEKTNLANPVHVAHDGRRHWTISSGPNHNPPGTLRDWF